MVNNNAQLPSPLSFGAMATSTDDAVDAPCIAWNDMAAHWPLILDLLGGTPAMRAAGKRWLPQERAESMVQYAARLDRSILYGAFKDTVKRLSGKPFSRPVTLDLDAEEEPELLTALMENADLQGRGMTQLARDVYEDGVTYGLGHILIDFPAIGRELTLAEERSMGVRPYMTRISPVDLIGWRHEPGTNGERKLIEIRFRERVVVPDGEFGQKVAYRIRVVRPNEWQLWQEDDEGDFKLVEQGANTLGIVPLVTFYANRTGDMEALPPLEDLAWLNLAHWQSLSDQRNILRFARVGILFGSGFQEEEVEQGITIGPTQMIASTNPEARLQYVEHSGAAIQSGERDLEQLEARMETLGLTPFIERTGNQTATGRVLDESKSQSAVQTWVRDLENALEQAIEIAAGWQKVELPEYAVNIFSDFTITQSRDGDAKLLLAMRAAGEISHATFLNEIKRRGILSDAVDAAEEADALGDEDLAEMRRMIDEQESEPEDEPEGDDGE